MYITLHQIDTIVGDFEGNSKKIIKFINKDKGNINLNIMAFPELAVSGYPPLDLLDSEDFFQKQNFYVSKIIEATVDIKTLVIFGYIERNNDKGKKLYNSLMVCSNGQVIYNYRKRLLPTYDVFDERRYFEPGNEVGIFYYNKKRIGVVICEDLWYQESLYDQNPAQELFMRNVDVIISINASPSVVKKYTKKVLMIRGISRTYGIPIAYVNMVGGNDDLIFDGNSFITNPYGLIIKQAKRYKEDTIEVSFEEFSNAFYSISANYFANDSQFFFEQIRAGIKSYFTKCNFRSIVVALSGGIDSAVVTAMAYEAVGKDKVFAITMPSQYSSEGSYKDSQLLCDKYGIALYTYPIEELFNIHKESFHKIFDMEQNSDIMEENLQARIRGLTLMSFSNKYGSLVLSTGNKSELSVGYCTVGGDMLGGLAPISDLYKTEVYQLARYINKFNKDEKIPRQIIEKEPSAELSPNQKDSDSLPPYKILDPILKYFIEGDTLEEDERSYLEEFVIHNKNEARKIAFLLDGAEFKRRQAPITIKVHEKAFGYGRRIPIVKTLGFFKI